MKYGACLLMVQSPQNTQGQYFDFDFLADFCLLGFRGTAARALMTRLEGFCFRFVFGFSVALLCAFFLEVLLFAVRFLAFDRAFFRDFNVPCMPAWATERAFLTSSRRFLIAMSPSCSLNGLRFVLIARMDRSPRRFRPIVVSR